MKVFVAHLIVMGILKKNSLEQYWSTDSILNMPFLVTTCPEIIFKTSCGIFMSAIQMRPTHQREKQTMILCFWLGQWWTWCKGISVQKYRQGKELSLGESMCPFKDRVHFKCYNPKKPNRFHINTSKMVSCQMHYRHDVNMAAFRIRASFSDEFQSICDKMYTIATIEQYYEWKNSWMKLLICSLTYPEGLPGGMQRSTPCFLLLDNLATPTSHRLKAAMQCLSAKDKYD